MYIAVSEYDMIHAHGETPSECASQILDWKLDTDTGTLTVDGKVQGNSYAVYANDKRNGFKPHEMLAEARKDLLKIAERKGYKFYKRI